MSSFSREKNWQSFTVRVKYADSCKDGSYARRGYFNTQPPASDRNSLSLTGKNLFSPLAWKAPTQHHNASGDPVSTLAQLASMWFLFPFLSEKICPLVSAEAWQLSATKSGCAKAGSGLGFCSIQLISSWRCVGRLQFVWGIVVGEGSHQLLWLNELVHDSTR